MNKQKGSIPLLIVLGVIFAIVIATGAYYAGTLKTPKPQPQNPVIISNNQSPQPNQTTPIPTTVKTNNQDGTANFNFTLKYGVSNKSGAPRNILNTSKQTYTKDMFLIKI